MDESKVSNKDARIIMNNFHGTLRRLRDENLKRGLSIPWLDKMIGEEGELMVKLERFLEKRKEGSDK